MKYRKKSRVDQRIDLQIDGQTTQQSKRLEVKKTSTQSTWYYLGAVGDIGFTIALPIVAGALLGKVIDERFGWYPRATLSFLLVGVLISVVGFIKKIQDIIRS